MRVALVHDYIKEFGGAERVLEELHKLFPEAPIYTAFYKNDSSAYKRFKGAKIIPSWAHYFPFFADKLHSPFRFITPLIWGSFNFSKYDVVISSASWYITKGFGRRGSKDGRPIEICYCHTPPRWLYGYRTSIEWQRYWPIKLYGMIVGHFMRLYDFKMAQKVDYFIANSEEVRDRIKKFYRRDAVVINPPVHLPGIKNNESRIMKKKDYYLVVGRIVGSKGLDLAVEVAQKLNIKLKIVGIPAGYYTGYKKLSEKASQNVEFLGHVNDEELVKLYSGAKAFLALAEDEDFGITPVESMLCGTPVIAFYGGGYRETVIDGKTPLRQVSAGQAGTKQKATGVFFHEYTAESLIDAIKKFESEKISSEACIKQAQKFSAEVFDKKILDFVQSLTK